MKIKNENMDLQLNLKHCRPMRHSTVNRYEYRRLIKYVICKLIVENF